MIHALAVLGIFAGVCFLCWLGLDWLVGDDAATEERVAITDDRGIHVIPLDDLPLWLMDEGEGVVTIEYLPAVAISPRVCPGNRQPRRRPRGGIGAAGHGHPS